MSADGEVVVTQARLDLSTIDEDVCVQLQGEERDAIQAIYAELVTFDVRNETMDPEEEKEDEAKAEADQPDTHTSASHTTEEAAAVSAGGVAREEQCIGICVKIQPYPASGPDRNQVSATVRFTLPPLYPFVRPSFDIVGVDGMEQADALMCGMTLDEALNTLYRVEPMPADDAHVVLFELTNAVQAFLVEYVEYLEDADYHAQLQKETDERARADAIRRAYAEAERRHTEAAMAYHLSDHKKLEWADSVKECTDTAELRARHLKSAQEEERRREAARVAAHELQRKEALAEEERFSESMRHGHLRLGHIRPTPDQVLSHIKATDRDFLPDYFQAFKREQLYFEDITSAFLTYRPADSDADSSCSNGAKCIGSRSFPSRAPSLPLPLAFLVSSLMRLSGS